MNRCFVVAGILLVPLVAVVEAAEMGRQAVRGGGVPVEEAYRGALTESGTGFEASLDWSAMEWDIGDESYSDSTFVPGLALSYGLGQWADIRFTTRYAAPSDEADLDVWRLGVGSRAWLPLGGDVVPYAGLGLNYYIFDSDDAGDIEGTIGLSAEAGVAFLLGEFSAIRAGIQLETTVQDGEATVGDEDVDVSLSAFSFGIGYVLLF